MEIILISTLFALLIKFYMDKIAYRHTIKYRKRRGKYIYFYMSKGTLSPTVKIGRAKDAVQRLKAQKTPLPYGMRVLGVIKVKDDVVAERMIHKKFSLQRIHEDKRNEWFWLTPSVLWYILAVRDMKLTRKVRHEVSN